MIKQYLKVIRDCSQRTGNKKILGLGGGGGRVWKEIELMDAETVFKSASLLEKGEQVEKAFHNR